MTFEDIRKILKDKKIGIAGCGGLGSNCAAALVRTGVGFLVIADYDVIDQSNLNRQFFFLNQVGRKKVFALKDNLMAIDPDVAIEAYDIMLEPDSVEKIFSDCDLIIEAFDEASQKQMIIETVLERFPEKYIIAGLGVAGWGGNNDINTRKHGNLYVCGDQKTEAKEDVPSLAPRVGVVANMQANQAIELLLKVKGYEDIA